MAQKDIEIAFWKAEAELLKKIELKERQVIKGKVKPSLVYEIIIKYGIKGQIKHLCKISGVSTSGYYRYISTKEIRENKEDKDLLLKNMILEAFNFKGYKKGSRSIKMFLENKFGIIINRKCIQRIMRKYNIFCPIRKANPYRRMMKATMEHRVCPNLVKRNFKQDEVGKIILTDITYLPYSNSKTAYLSVMKDAQTNLCNLISLSRRLRYS